MTYNIISTRKIKKTISVKQPDDLFKFLKRYIKSRQEMFLTVTFTTLNEIIGIHIVTIGLLNHCIIHPREVFIHAIKDNAAGIIIVHNRPSGKVEPSSQDKEITHDLNNASKILGISLLDHLIIGKNGYYSFKQNGKLN
jgi:DNA repair protein RadC